MGINSSKYKQSDTKPKKTSLIPSFLRASIIWKDRQKETSEAKDSQQERPETNGTPKEKSEPKDEPLERSKPQNYRRMKCKPPKLFHTTENGFYDDIDDNSKNDTQKETSVTDNDYICMAKIWSKNHENNPEDDGLEYATVTGKIEGLFGELYEEHNDLTLNEWFDLIKSGTGRDDGRNKIAHADDNVTVGSDDHDSNFGEKDKNYIGMYGNSKANHGPETSQDFKIQNIVEACRPLFEEHIRVTEVLPYLLFLDDTEAIHAKERESSKQAVSLLLEQLQKSAEAGKWTTFFNALDITGYQYLTKLLKGDPTLDITRHKNLLKIFTPKLLKELLPSDLIHHLYEKDVISSKDREEIECEQKNRGTSLASLMLLDRIPRRHPNWYNEFLTSLRACGFAFIADTLDETQVDRRYSSTGYSGTVSDGPLQNMPESGSPYITPTYLPAARRKESDCPPPPPIPRRHQVSASIPMSNPVSIPNTRDTGKNLSLKFSPHTEYLDEKKRLTMALIDITEKIRLEKEIRRLTHEIHTLMNEGADVDDIYIDSNETPAYASIKKSENEGVGTISSIKAYKATEDSTKKESKSIVKGVDTDIKLDSDDEKCEKVIKTILESIKTHISEEINTAVRKSIPPGVQSIPWDTDRSANNTVQKFDLAVSVPKAHTAQRHHSADSGLCYNCRSASSMLLDEDYK